MTCRMAAGQQKKRLASSNLHEQYRGKKKKKLDSSDYVLNLRSHIDLEWDDNLKRAVAKREQVGITWMYMASFVDSVPKSHSDLADVISVPQEIFSLENLTEVLSYEVWATCLSESERKLLTQFLPSGTGVEHAVHSLLNGENHHFGNLYLKWSASLCAGNLHPDAVVRTEQQFRANRRAYYYEINKYHTGMLEVLKKWKEKWLRCKDPEKLWREGFTKHKQGSLTVSAEMAKVPIIAKKEIPHKVNIRNGDIAKYMSYIKVSKTQHQLVKNIKHSGDGIQSKFLHRVLGDIKSFHVQPYETFEEEEQKRLHEHWLQVANKDIPAAFELCRNKKLLREQWMKSLRQELAEKNKLTMDKDEKMENVETSPKKSVENGDYEHQPSPDMTDQEDADSPHNSTHDHHLERIQSLNSHLDPSLIGSSPIAVNKAVGPDILELTENSPSLSQSLENQNPSDEDVTRAKASSSSAKDMWQTESINDPYYQTTPESHEYLSAGELSLRQPQFTEECPTDVIDLERNIIEPESGATVASTFHLDSGASVFCSYANQDCNELLPNFSKGPGMLSSYPHEQMNGVKQPGLQFLMANDSLSEPGQFSHQFHGEQKLLGQREVREKELYMNQIMNKNVYSGGRYPSQGHFSSVDQQSFSALQSSVNGGSMGYNWFPGEHQAYTNWSGAESSSSQGQCLLDGSNADGSLFSVFSNKISSCSPYDTASSGQYIQARSYTSGAVPPAENIYRYAHHQLDNSDRQEATTAPSMNNMSWMNFPRQNPGLHDSMGKPFLGPWNR
uniref:Uncharacterized protein LOC105060379 n=1 Tax=Elaeis guineensis var. tenera TaxID=51953 RepID=A0A6I9SG13_ELAGV|nr:uncharacterized protein LOC105060379 [Elaeis guineensis]XP_010942351.1 uncharacterized protein LOC105060379 [Elaeis guineensis]XP_010942353.1 uncharacterized protein LOC105060379 [Elaeis guineensis]XP_019701301.1 uncharacterized protein LOC105060379 [Elaeis guineensis]XP_029116364.1 uncharacterized protein LOC105060379 [Elaeis guineensis]